MPKKKSILGFVLLILLLVPFFTTGYLVVKKHLLQKDYLERLQDKPLEKLELKAADILWVKEGKELQINNRLFDVKSIVYKNGMASITGWYDEKEEKINKKLAQKNTNEEREYTFFLGYPFTEPFIHPSAPKPFVCIIMHFSINAFPLLNHSIETTTPPPNDLV